jgi:hypothetical protein
MDHPAVRSGPGTRSPWLWAHWTGLKPSLKAKAVLKEEDLFYLNFILYGGCTSISFSLPDCQLT